MWTHRKYRFLFVMSLLIAANVVAWVTHKAFGVNILATYSMCVYALDYSVVILFAVIGFYTSFILAFAPEALKRSIERSIAKQATRNL
jgi:hypothetical protein